MTSTFRSLHPNIRVRILTTFLSKVFGTTVIPFMGLFFAREAGEITAGILLAAQYFLQFIISLYGGAASDFMGRKRIVLWGESFKVLAFTLMLLASLSKISIWPMFIGLLVLAVGNGFSNPAGEAMLIDASTAENRAFMYTVNYWGNNLGYLLGAPLGALLFYDHLSVLMALMTAISMLIMWVTLRFIKDVQSLTSQTGRKPIGLNGLVTSYRKVAADHAFLWFTLSGVLIMTIEFARTTFLAVRLDHDFSGRVVNLPLLGSVLFDGARALALLSAENTFFIVLGAVAVARFLFGRDSRLWMTIGFVFFGVGYSVAMIVNTPIALLLAGLGLSFGELLHVPTRQTVLADMIESDKRGAYMAINGMIFQFGKLFAAGGLVLWPFLGKNGLALLILGFTLIGSFIGLKASSNNRNSHVLAISNATND
jgi:MFS transporter, DHA1 family, multidrug resistance protein B